jgi:hypothetical protein
MMCFETLVIPVGLDDYVAIPVDKEGNHLEGSNRFYPVIALERYPVTALLYPVILTKGRVVSAKNIEGIVYWRIARRDPTLHSTYEDTEEPGCI